MSKYQGVDKIKIGICDDEKEYLDHIKQMIEQWTYENNIIADICCFDNGDSLISKCTKDKINIVFLDIVMPLLNGIDTAHELRNLDKAVKIIFITSSTEYALESYSVKATDYCLKPIRYEKIKEILDDLIHQMNIEPPNIVLKTICGYYKVYLNDIEYVEAQNKRILFFLRSGKTLETNEPLYTFENMLLIEDGFFKCHRSYIVYIPSVDNFNLNEIKTKSGRIIPIARGYGKTFGEAYFSFMFRDKEA